MPRAGRVFIEGGVYHVYNRVSRGESVFAEQTEAECFVSLLFVEGSERTRRFRDLCVVPDVEPLSPRVEDGRGTARQVHEKPPAAIHSRV